MALGAMIGTTAVAQRNNKKNITAEGVNDPAAHDILKDVRKNFKAYKSINVEFTYTLENKQEKIKETKKGKALMSGHKYAIDFMGQQVISDGKTTWTYISDAKEVQITDADPKAAESSNPLAIIDKYEKNFRAKLIREENGQYIVDLIPLKTKNFHKIRVYIDKTKMMLTSSEVYDKNGSVYTYKITKMDTKVQTSNKDFIFDKSKYPGVAVVDMREFCAVLAKDVYNLPIICIAGYVG